MPKLSLKNREQTTIRLWRGQNLTAWCAPFKAQTERHAPTVAARLSNTTRIEIFLRIESGEPHVKETGVGANVICDAARSWAKVMK